MRQRDSNGRFIHDNKLRLIQCLCGCRQLLLNKDEDGKPTRYILGHNLKMRAKERKLVPCACGCGELILSLGRQCKPVQFKHGHNAVGRKLDSPEKHSNWRGGITKRGGYIYRRAEGHPRADKENGHHYVPEQVLVMEQYLGGYLWDWEIVHHMNGIKDDNRIENLDLVTKAEHAKIHHPEIYRWMGHKKEVIEVSFKPRGCN
jgi:hypothetical protein